MQPSAYGTQIRNPNFGEVAALRLSGQGNLQFADARVGLQVMRAVITDSADLTAWTEDELGWSKEETLERLREQFGELEPNDLGTYVYWLYELRPKVVVREAT